MRYVLNSQFVLRGWKRLPWAVMHRPENSVRFLDASTFRALELCDGAIDFDLPIITDRLREIVMELERWGVVRALADGEHAALAHDQRYARYPNRFIETAHWSITGRCNYRCRHCFMDAPGAKLGELDHDTVMDIARQIVEAGILRVSLTGGEPLVRGDFLEIVGFLAEHHVLVSQIYSNGRLVTRELLETLADLGVHPEINMSFDGTEGWHDWLRGVDGATDDVLRAFDLCSEIGFPTGAEMCLHKGNIHTLRDSVNLLAEHGCSSLKTNPVASTDAWEKHGRRDYDLSTEEVAEAYLDYIPHYFEDGMPLSIMLGGMFSCEKGSVDWYIPRARFAVCDAETDPDEDVEEACLAACVCGHARTTLYISPEGRMLPCMPLSALPDQSGFPTVQDVGLAQGLSDSEYLRLITTTVAEYLERNPECAACEFRLSCGGGCRGSALLTTRDDAMAPDRAICALYRGGYYDRVREVAQSAVAARGKGEAIVGGDEDDKRGRASLVESGRVAEAENERRPS